MASLVAPAQNTLLTSFDLHLLNEGKHIRLFEKLGAHVTEFDGRRGTNFAVWAPNAEEVSVVGDFNHWNPRAVPLKRSADGTTWEAEVLLPPGRYAYAYFVDGVLARDPRAPQVRDDDFGSPNSILMVKGS